jgi:CDP-diacylglycerol--glycerol-3-phosphate 3-phosphatidyltransferase
MRLALPKKFISDKTKDNYAKAIKPVIDFFHRIDASPNAFTTAGLVISVGGAYFASKGSFRTASLFLLAAGLCDTIDGKLARSSGKASKFGALYDSSLDRYSEAIYFLGLAFYFVHAGWYKTAVAVFVGLSGSMMVSYVRARAEGLGFECKDGILQRAERILILVAGGLIHLYALVGAIWIIAIFSNITAVQRILHIRKKDREAGTAAV